MAQVTVRNLDDQVIITLKRKAVLHGNSLERELSKILTDSIQLSATERVATSRRIRAMASVGVAQADSATLIRDSRDSR
ncbi:MAG: hypothetical protein VCB77_04660 [Alphaproteobacteria bacterium]